MRMHNLSQISAYLSKHQSKAAKVGGELKEPPGKPRPGLMREIFIRNYRLNEVDKKAVSVLLHLNCVEVVFSCLPFSLHNGS